MTLFVELGRIEMGSWMEWLREELEGLNAQARELEATLADWTTPQPFALPDLGPGIDGERREALELVLFGSRASGTARPDSDLDLLVAPL